MGVTFAAKCRLGNGAKAGVDIQGKGSRWLCATQKQTRKLFRDGSIAQYMQRKRENAWKHRRSKACKADEGGLKAELRDIMIL